MNPPNLFKVASVRAGKPSGTMTPLLALLALAPAPLAAGKTVDLPKKGGFDALAFDADDHRVLAAHSGANTLTVLDTRTGKVTEVETGSVNGIGISKKHDRYFVAGRDKEVVAVDRKTLKVVARVPVSGPADLVAVDPRRDQVYVVHDDGKELWVFDAATLKSVGSVATEEAPEFFEYDPAADRIFLNIKSTNHLQVIVPATHKVTATWDTAPMQSPHGLALDLKAKRAYSAGRNGKLVVLDLATGKVLKAIDVTTGIDQIGYDPDLGRVYCPGAGKLSVVSTATGSVIGEVPLPKGSRNITVDPTTHTVWMALNDDAGSRLMSFRAVR